MKKSKKSLKNSSKDVSPSESKLKDWSSKIVGNDISNSYGEILYKCMVKGENVSLFSTDCAFIEDEINQSPIGTASSIQECQEYLGYVCELVQNNNMSDFPFCMHNDSIRQGFYSCEAITTYGDIADYVGCILAHALTLGYNHDEGHSLF